MLWRQKWHKGKSWHWRINITHIVLFLLTSDLCLAPFTPTKWTPIKWESYIWNCRNYFKVCLVSCLSVSPLLSHFSSFLFLYALISVCACFSDAPNGGRRWFKLCLCVRTWFHTRQPYFPVSTHTGQIARVSRRIHPVSVCGAAHVLVLVAWMHVFVIIHMCMCALFPAPSFACLNRIKCIEGISNKQFFDRRH